VDLDVVRAWADHADGRVLEKVDRGGLDGSQERCSEFARVEAVLVELNEVVVAGLELGEKYGEWVWGECGGLRRVNGLQAGFGVKGNWDAGEFFQVGEPVGVEGEAEVREGL
jgi:hypothetical protein